MAEDRRVVIGTRGSDLALWQSKAVAEMLREAHPGLVVELEVIETKGDRILDVALSRIGDKGLFTKELESALLDGRIDLAVHSLKDMQTVIPEGLRLGAVTERAAPEDALVAQPGTTIESLPQGAVVATGSLRRRAQLLHRRPDLRIAEVRGNVPTRLRRYRENGWDGIILARAGLERLELAGEIAQVIDPEVMIPAVGQGALGIEIRDDDSGLLELVRALEHSATRIAAEAERAFLRRLEGGCQAPIGAFAVVDGEMLRLTGLVASPDGTRTVRDEIEGEKKDAEEIGDLLAERVLSAGGAEIMEEVARHQT